MTLQQDVDVVVGIRIGTNDISVAWLFSKDKTSYLSPTWHNPSTERLSSDLPTIAVYSTDNVFQAFGYEALKQIQEQKSGDLLVFSNFVKDIFCSDVDVPVDVSAENGAIASSLDLISDVISYLIRHLALPEIGPLRKRYVFTIPSRTCENHVKFLESASKNVILAGLHEHQVLVIPEVASIIHFYKHNHRVHQDGKEFDPFIADKQNVVLEREDDNINISILRLQEDDSIEIVYNSLESEITFSQVQQDFDDLFVQIFGKSVFDDFCQENKSDHYELLHTLQCKMKQPPTERITFSLPARLLVLFKEKTGEQIEKAIKETNLVSKVSIKNGKCRIAFDVFQRLFMDSGKNVVKLLQKLDVCKGHDENVNIILAGQFSNSVSFQDTIRRAFPYHHIIAEGDLIVTKGAALYGHRPVKISQKERPCYTAQVAKGKSSKRKKWRKKQSCSIL